MNLNDKIKTATWYATFDATFQVLRDITSKADWYVVLDGTYSEPLNIARNAISHFLSDLPYEL